MHVTLDGRTDGAAFALECADERGGNGRMEYHKSGDPHSQDNFNSPFLSQGGPFPRKHHTNTPKYQGFHCSSAIKSRIYTGLTVRFWLGAIFFWLLILLFQWQNDTHSPDNFNSPFLSQGGPFPPETSQECPKASTLSLFVCHKISRLYRVVFWSGAMFCWLMISLFQWLNNSDQASANRAVSELK